MGKYKTYPEYQITDISGLEELPSHWNTKQIRYLLKDGAEGIKIGPFGSALKLEDMVENGIFVFGQENVIKKNFLLGKRRISDAKFKEMEVYKASPGDILITMMGTSGKCEIVPEAAALGIIDSHLLRLRVREDLVKSEFFKLLIDESPEVAFQIRQQGKGSIMHGLNSSIVKSLFLPLPDIEEQSTILSFLTYETAKIDTLIEKQQQLIKLLKEKRQAVISHAVTKGLNPHAPMKDSGVEWLGEVPEHWDVIQFRRFTSLSQGLQIPQSERFYEPDVNRIEYITIKSIHAGEASEYKEYIHKPSSRVVCFKDDVLLARTGATGEVVTGVYGAFHNNFFKVKYSKLIVKNFLVNLLKVQELKSHLLMLAGTTTIPDLNHGAFLGTKVALPPLAEQKEICSEIKRQNIKYDQLLSVAGKQVDLLKERRTAIISAAVTGKIDVRNWQAPTSQEQALEQTA